MNLTTERLEIRTISGADLELYCQIYCDPEAMRFVAPAFERAKAERCFAYALKESLKTEQNLCLMSIAWRSCGTKVGFCGYQRTAHDANIFEPGFMLVPSSRRLGLATEVLALLCQKLFCQTAATEIWLQYRADHVAADRLVKRLGFMIQHQAQLGKCADTLMCRGILRR